MFYLKEYTKHISYEPLQLDEFLPQNTTSKLPRQKIVFKTEKLEKSIRRGGRIIRLFVISLSVFMGRLESDLSG